ncbi:MAG: hypothetical protein ACYCOU_22385 [Sulfobacillus sp.]
MKSIVVEGSRDVARRLEAIKGLGLKAPPGEKWQILTSDFTGMYTELQHALILMWVGTAVQKTVDSKELNALAKQKIMSVLTSLLNSSVIFEKQTNSFMK